MIDGTFLQPDFTSIWADLDEEAKAVIFPLLKGEDRHALLAISKERFDAEAREIQLSEKAAETLFWRDVKKRADELDAERSGLADSWTEQSIDDLFDTEQITPDIGSFVEDEMSNGGGVFYSGKVNEIHGPSESGKTMVILAVAAQEIRDDNHVVMIDFEDDGRSIVNRLRYVFGLDREQIVKRFHYFRPDVAFSEKALAHIQGIDGVTLCIIDAVTEGMSIAGLDGRNENEVATWYNEFPKKLASLGMGVVLVDHTPQDNHARQIGSQHKKSAVDGVSYTAEPISPFVKGQRGQLRLKVAKDKPGGVRPDALPQGDGKQYWRGDFKIDGRGAPDSPIVVLYGVDPHAFEIGATGQDQGLARKDVQPVIPPPAQAVILEILAASGEWMSAQSIQQWHNDQLDPKDERRLSRTAPRKLAVELIKKGLAERRDSGGSVAYRISPMGLHSVNALACERAKDPQLSLEQMYEEEGESGPDLHEPSEP